MPEYYDWNCWEIIEKHEYYWNLRFIVRVIKGEEGGREVMMHRKVRQVTHAGRKLTLYNNTSQLLFFCKCLSILSGQTHTLECKLDMGWKVQLTAFCSFVFTYVCITRCVIKTHMSWGDDIDIIHVLLAEFLHTHYLTSRWRPVFLRPLQVLIQFSFMNVQFWLERALIHKRFENCKKTT